MLTHCLHWELGHTAPPARELTQRLQELSHTDALLVLSKTSFPADWEQAHFCTLLNGPSRFARLYTREKLNTEFAQAQARLHQNWTAQFAEVRELAQQGGPWQEPANSLTSDIKTRLEWEEKNVYPRVSTYLGHPRPTQQLLYEHQGIRHFLADLEPTLRSLQTDPGVVGTKAWSKLAINLIHLIEHHSQHEEAVFLLYGET